MLEAARLGEAARGRTAPNPNVGTVIVRDGEIIGRGATAPGGRPHAEAVALAEAGEKAKSATLYTTLEPCAHLSERGEGIFGVAIATAHAASARPLPSTLTHRATLELVRR